MVKSSKQDHKNLHGIAAAIFTIISIMHLLRIYYQIPVKAGLWTVPMTLSWFAFLFSGLLAIAFWKRR